MPPADDEARKVAEKIARKLFRYLSMNERAAELLLPILAAAFERVKREVLARWCSCICHEDGMEADSLRAQVEKLKAEEQEWADAVACGGGSACKTPGDECWEHLVRALRAQLSEAQEKLAALESRCFEGYPSVSDGIFDHAKELERQLSEAQASKDRCWTCGGQDDPSCACGGTGSHATEVQYMRERCLSLDTALFEAQQRVEALEEALQSILDCGWDCAAPSLTCQQRAAQALARPEAHTPEVKPCSCKPGQGYHDRLCAQWSNPYTPDEERAYAEQTDEPKP